jgi:DNA-binding NarL/FixJ family response regulator
VEAVECVRGECQCEVCLNPIFDTKGKLLCPQEMLVLRMLACGWSLKRVAGELDITEGTAKVHAQTARKRLGLNSYVMSPMEFRLALHRHFPGEIKSIKCTRSRRSKMARRGGSPYEEER